jgi:hypothetical protein
VFEGVNYPIGRLHNNITYKMASANPIVGFDCEDGSLSTPQNIREANVNGRKKYVFAGSISVLFAASVVMGYCALGPLMQKAMTSSGHGHAHGKAAFAASMMPLTKVTRGAPVMKADADMNRRDFVTAAAATGFAGLATNAQPAFAKDAKSDVDRAKAAFDKSEKAIRADLKTIENARADGSNWWLAKVDVDGPANQIKADMVALNKVSKNPAASKAKQDEFFAKVDEFNKACDKKDKPAAETAWAQAVEALDEYRAEATGESVATSRL